jgi:hypothetical protein
VYTSDKGLNAFSEFLEKGAELVQPPRREDNKIQLEPTEVEETAMQACVRIHVERLIGRVKMSWPHVARIQQGNSLHMISQVIKVCAWLSDLQDGPIGPGDMHDHEQSRSEHMRSGGAELGCPSNPESAPAEDVAADEAMIQDLTAGDDGLHYMYLLSEEGPEEGGSDYVDTFLPLSLNSQPGMDHDDRGDFDVLSALFDSQ